MAKHEKSAELEGQEAVDAMQSSWRMEQQLSAGTILTEMFLIYLTNGDSPEFRESLRQVTINYLQDCLYHRQVIRPVVPGWVEYLLVIDAPLFVRPGASRYESEDE